MKKKIRLKKSVKKLLIKSLITLLVLIIDVVLSHYLGIYGSLAVENTWHSTFILVGWFWLLAGHFIALHMMWDEYYGKNANS